MTCARALVLTLAAAAAGACSGTGAAPDAGSPDATEAPDAVAPDAGPLDHCLPGGPLPAWAERPALHRAIARCDGASLFVDALDGGVARLRYAVDGAGDEAPRSWAVGQTAPATAVVVGERDGDLIVCTGALAIAVTADSCRVTITDAAGRVLVSDGDAGGFTAGPGERVSVRRRAPAGERYYGFGEKTGRLDRRGRRLTFWNTDAYAPSAGGFLPDADPLYQSIPFFIALRDGVAHGVFTDNSHRLDVDVAASDPGHYVIDAAGGAIDQYVIAGPDIAGIVERYAALTGRTPLPPRWSLGYHQSRWGYWPDTRVEEVADRLRAEDIAADAVWLDIQHMDGYRTFTWDPAGFPDPDGLAARLAGDGFALVTIADPGIKIDEAWDVYTAGVAGDHFLRRSDGELYEGYVWPGPSVFPDFSRAATRAWWSEHIAAQLDHGVRGIWLDVNEPTNFPEAGGATIPDDVPVDGDGIATTMAELHNVYALLEARATYEGMLAGAPDRRPFILSRAGYAGIQRYAAVWTGDVVSDWDGLGGSLPMMLGMTLSGVPFVGTDVGGYSGNATPALYARWMALGSISPFFRAHVTSNVPGQEPWEMGTEARDISRSVIAERYRLLPYWYSLFDRAATTGTPPLRPLVYDFQDDPATYDIDDQAMVGSHLMVAPVVTEGAAVRSVYLPAGRWFEYHSGAIYDGPATIDVPVTLAALPMFARAGAIIPRGAAAAHTGAIADGPLELDVYPAPEPSSFTLYEDAGDGFAYRDSGAYARVTYTLEQLPDGARLTAAPREGTFAPPARDLIVRVRRVDSAVASVMRDGAALAEHATRAALDAAGSGWWYDAGDRSIVAIVPDAGAVALRFFYDPAIDVLRPPVPVELVVEVPVGTPADPPVHVATSASGWVHEPLAWTSPTTARGVVMVPRGEWFDYKYTRGDWDTVEKWPACEEASNRYRFGASTLSQDDTVFTWRDWCP